jgi:hypothetical protein
LYTYDSALKKSIKSLLNPSVKQSSIHQSTNQTNKQTINLPINQSFLWTDLSVIDDHGELAELSLQPVLLLQQLHPVLLRTSLYLSVWSCVADKK